jgi:hypothetical protein
VHRNETFDGFDLDDKLALDEQINAVALADFDAFKFFELFHANFFAPLRLCVNPLL